MKRNDEEGKAGRSRTAGKRKKERTGTFTSGIVSIRGGRRIALFFTGRRHAGENLQRVLQERASELGLAIQMCDALDRNLPRELRTLVANCVAHARRNFVDLADIFPAECLHVLEQLALVYKVDEEARRLGLSGAERLRLHEEKSAQVMEDLKAWLDSQLKAKKVEPNSSLGEAINYMLTRWEKLTVFLRVEGAPLDNSICERALKKAILLRKNSLFYKTQHGAQVGDLFLSLIHTCQLLGVNPFEYLGTLKRHAREIARAPGEWMPWNFKEKLVAKEAPEARPAS
jgi:hypothetical protein